MLKDQISLSTFPSISWSVRLWPQLPFSQNLKWTPVTQQTQMGFWGIFSKIRAVSVSARVGPTVQRWGNFPNCKYCGCLAFSTIVSHLLPDLAQPAKPLPRYQLKFVQFTATQILAKLCAAVGVVSDGSGSSLWILILVSKVEYLTLLAEKCVIGCRCLPPVPGSTNGDGELPAEDLSLYSGIWLHETGTSIASLVFL